MKVVLAGILIAGLLLVGCRADSSERDDFDPSLNSHGIPTSADGVAGPVIASATNKDGGMAALASHVRLELRDGCLLMREQILVWPSGTHWDAQTQTVRVPEWDHTPVVGEDFSVGGGSLSFLKGFPAAVDSVAQSRVMECHERLGVEQLWLVSPSEPSTASEAEFPPDFVKTMAAHGYVLETSRPHDAPGANRADAIREAMSMYGLLGPEDPVTAARFLVSTMNQHRTPMWVVYARARMLKDERNHDRGYVTGTVVVFVNAATGQAEQAITY